MSLPSLLLLLLPLLLPLTTPGTVRKGCRR
jgi:hypothetical protein